MGAVEPRELFVFAGAGASYCRPAGLPLFLPIRDELLIQLGLGRYVPGPAATRTRQQWVAAGLNPEPFMSALRQGDLEVGPWLDKVLRGRPNAVHYALAQLADAGAGVWTVNFDRLIEAAGPALRVSAWPADPAGGAQLLKPHGTLGGLLILESEQVLAPLAPAWEQRLREDVRGRTVVFLGYSGKDLDFQPIWDSVLADAGEVLWFDRQVPDDQARQRAILRRVDAAGRLHFPPPVVRNEDGQANPSADFLRWCLDRGLVHVPDDLAAELDRRVERVSSYPALDGDKVWGRLAVQHVVGDVPAALRTYRRLLARGPGRRRAASELVRSEANHGRRFAAAVLAAGTLLPPVGRAGGLRATARRKRLTVLANLGRHSTVLRLTARPGNSDTSTTLVLRSSALRMTGSLDQAVNTGQEAMERARAEHRAVLLANASFQTALALVWAYRLDEATTLLDSQLRPIAEIASSRWVAWADFVEACLAIHRGAADVGERAAYAEDAQKSIDAGLARFEAEGLVDGQIDMLTIRLTSLRLAGADDERYRQALAELQSRMTGPANGIRYARGHRFTREAVALDVAEFARLHTGDLAAARRRYRYAARSRYPIHAALGNLGLAAVDTQDGRPPQTAATAAALGRATDARLVTAEAERLLADHRRGNRPTRELFIP